MLIAAAACEMHPNAVIKGVELASTREGAGRGQRARARPTASTELPAIWIDGRVLSGERAIPA